LIKTLGKIINEDSKGFKSKQEYEILFTDSKHLWNTLNLKKDREQANDVFDALKQFIVRYSVLDYSSRPLLKNFYKYLLEIYRKLNLKNSYGQHIQKINDIKAQTSEQEISIEKRKVESNNKKLELLEKYFEYKNSITDLSHVISSTEISNVRSAQIINSITEITAIAKEKLKKTQQRLSSILGDCIIFACTVTYLGVFSHEKKIIFRTSLKETLENFSIECSPEWESTDSEVHCSLFREILEENGISKLINKADENQSTSILRSCFMQSHHNEFSSNQEDFQNKKSTKNDNKNDKEKKYTNSMLSESIFSLLFSPTTPVWFDSTGLLFEFVKNVLAEHNWTLDMYEQESNSHQSPTKLDNDKRVMSESQFSKSNQDETKTIRNDIICLHDLNVSTPEPNFENLSNIALKAHWAPILHKLSCFTIADAKDPRSQSKSNSLTRIVNKKVPIADSGLSMFQTVIFHNNFKLKMSHEYEAKATLLLVEPDTPKVFLEDSLKGSEHAENSLSYWPAIKACFMKHFPQTVEDYNGYEVSNYEEMQRLLNVEIPKLKDDLENFQWSFENIFCMAVSSLH